MRIYIFHLSRLNLEGVFVRTSQDNELDSLFECKFI